MIAAMLGGLFGRLVGRYRGALLAVIGILLYTLLVGAGASVVRAALMGGLSLFAVQLGRLIGSVNALLLDDHGYAPTNPQEWIANLRPQVGLLSVAARDRDGLALAGDAGGSGGLHAAADGSKRLDPPEHGRGADVGGGGEEVSRALAELLK